VTAAVHDGKREARQQRATLIAAASKAAKKGFREKDQEMTKVAVYNRKSILEPP
jgi:vacuolar-type H+-ATPase subunit H